jgi:hypothetical protein
MKTILFHDIAGGTSIVFDGRDTVKITVAHVPFSKLTMPLDLDDVDRLLAVREHAINPTFDLAEFFSEVFHAQPSAAMRAAEAFCIAAPSLAETLR